MGKRLVALIVALQCCTGAHAEMRESWVLTTDLWGNPLHEVLELARDGASIAGTLAGDPIEGRIDGPAVRFAVTAADGSRSNFEGTLDGDSLHGSVDAPDTNDRQRRAQHAFVGRRVPERPLQTPRQLDYEPDDYSNVFSAEREPVLTIWPGDIVRTKTIDSGGVDERGDTRALYGNPQTGPFFVATAVPGDTLVIHIRRLRLNRDSADSLDDIVARARTTRLAARAGELGKPARWTLDRAHGSARPSNPGERLKNYAVAVEPMLGGLAVAPGFSQPPVSTGDTGRFGGNMDYNAITEGSTVHLPVLQPGALLYLGDAHAVQGDGEITQFALETSMDVEFSVEVIHGMSPSTPRIETGTHIAALGQAGSLDDALRAATAGLIEWLQQDYALDLSECAQVLGTSVEYRVANLAGRSVSIAARLEKSRLAGLKRVGKE